MEYKRLIFLSAIFLILNLFAGKICAQEIETEEIKNYYMTHDENNNIKFVQKLSWNEVGTIKYFKVTIQKSVDGEYENVLEKEQKENFIEVSFGPGKYRFQVAAVDVFDKIPKISEWKEFEIRQVIQPQLENVELDALYRFGDRIFTIAGKNFSPQTEFKLQDENGNNYSGRILEINDEQNIAKVQFDLEEPANGNYELFVSNPGGLSDSYKNVNVKDVRIVKVEKIEKKPKEVVEKPKKEKEPKEKKVKEPKEPKEKKVKEPKEKKVKEPKEPKEKKPSNAHVQFAAGYAPLFTPFDGKLENTIDKKFILIGGQAKISVLGAFNKNNYFGGGVSINYAQFKNETELYDFKGDEFNIIADLIYQKFFKKDFIKLDLHAGAGISMLHNLQFIYNQNFLGVDYESPAENFLGLAFNGGFALQFYPGKKKHFFFEVGGDFVFSKFKDMNFIQIVPSVSIGGMF